MLKKKKNADNFMLIEKNICQKININMSLLIAGVLSWT